MVYQCVPNTSISGQFERMILTILQQITILLLRIDGHQGMELWLCKIVKSFYLQIGNIFPHISVHDLSYHRTLRRCLRQVSQNKVAFLLLLQRFWIRTYHQKNVHRIFAGLTFSLSTTQINMVKELWWFSQIHFFHRYFPHWVNVISSKPVFLSSIYTDEEYPFSRFRNKHSQFWNFFPTVLQ